MQTFVDLFDRKIILTEEIKSHILKRPEMINHEDKIKETLNAPELLKRSVSDEKVVIYYKYYIKTPVTHKYLAVIVKINDKENFIISAYFTDRIKKGEIVWKKT
ncbi:hypothetical protein HYX03_02935 [Candidatus Woesearchaeota archaeon]|nr:hypothetical protein [Candidatus Woesearchaeota archaeon]